MTPDIGYECPHCSNQANRLPRPVLTWAVTARGEVWRCWQCGGEWTDRLEPKVNPDAGPQEAVANQITAIPPRRLARVYPWKCITHRYAECDLIMHEQSCEDGN